MSYIWGSIVTMIKGMTPEQAEEVKQEFPRRYDLVTKKRLMEGKPRYPEHWTKEMKKALKDMADSKIHTKYRKSIPPQMPSSVSMEEIDAYLELEYNLETRKRKREGYHSLPAHWNAADKQNYKIRATKRVRYKSRPATSRTIQQQYSSYIKSAKRRNLLFELSKQQFNDIMHRDCYYCDKSPAWGIDRYDNSIGYVPINCVPCCGMCNTAKGRILAQKFINCLDRVSRANRAENDQIQ